MPIVFSGKTVSIKEMEIFKTGVWNGQEFNDEDILLMANNFSSLRHQLVPKLKITHREDQKSLAGLASYGDIVNIYARPVAGNLRLFADIDFVPDEVAQWIKSKRFAERSIELHYIYTVNEKTYKKVITAVALLGSEIPAVAGMAPVSLSKEDNELNTQELVGVAFDLDESALDFKVEGSINNEGGDAMELKDIVAKLSSIEDVIAGLVKMQKDAEEKMASQKKTEEVEALKGQIAQYTKQLEEAKTQKADFEKIKVSLETSEKKAKDAEVAKEEAFKKLKESEVSTFISEQKAAGKILPAFENEVKALLMSLSSDSKIGKFAVINAEGKSSETELSQFEVIKNLISKLPQLVKFGEGAPAAGGGNSMEKKTDMEITGTTFELSSVELDEAAKKYMEEHKCSYADAVIKVSAKFKAEGKAQGLTTDE